MAISEYEECINKLHSLRSQYHEICEAERRISQTSPDGLWIECIKDNRCFYKGSPVGDLGLQEDFMDFIRESFLLKLASRKREIEEYFKKTIGGMPNEQ
ncbi:hypothetical protein [Listeria booriae]|uniref:hypothetical protein n=1 Tax=Listeria booriae TaxID=1552123 RepID=UPI00162538F2|nr:hypothetical protein [Listeria booriae]MBC2391326.1 hypothetical protein [Listeria booriae]